MIYAREYHEIEIDRTLQPSTYTLVLYIWKGSSDGLPATAEYSITKSNTENLTTPDYINISPLVLDFIEPIENNFVEGLNNYNDAVWVEWQVFLNNDVEYSQRGIDLAVNGYNSEDKEVLLNGGELSMYDNFIVPFKTGNTITVLSYPSSEINNTYVTTSSLLSNEQIKHLFIKRPTTDKYIKVSNGTENYYIYLEDKNKYQVNEVKFINSYGAIQILPFYSERKDKLTINKETYKAKSFKTNHKYVNFNLNGRDGITLQSNYHSEESNQVFEALMLSEFVWCNDVPVNVKSSNISYKTTVNDKLISYSIELEVSSDKIRTF